MDRRIREVPFEWSAFRDADPSSHKVFILGMGRSGTHFLARALGQHEGIAVNIEDRVIFPAIVSAGLYPRRERFLLPAIELGLRIRHAQVAPAHLVDKSHPALWLAEALARRLPSSRFIGLVRSPYATVASALRHKGVSGWHDNWRDYPIPNRFLGISEDVASEYDSLTRVEQLALRWRAHTDELRRLEGLFGARMLLMKYESLVLRPEDELERVARFLQLSTPIPSPAPNLASLDRWKRELDTEAVSAVARLTGS